MPLASEGLYKFIYSRLSVRRLLELVGYNR